MGESKGYSRQNWYRIFFVVDVLDMGVGIDVRCESGITNLSQLVNRESGGMMRLRTRGKLYKTVLKVVVVGKWKVK